MSFLCLDLVPEVSHFSLLVQVQEGLDDDAQQVVSTLDCRRFTSTRSMSFGGASRIIRLTFASSSSVGILPISRGSPNPAGHSFSIPVKSTAYNIANR